MNTEPYTINDVKSTICDANNLYRAYLNTIKSSKWKETTQKFALNYLRNIFKLSDELASMEYKPGQEGEFVLNERGKIRVITTLQPRDRMVRHILCDDILMPVIRPKLIYDNHASIKNRGMALHRKRFDMHLHKFYRKYGNKGYILLGDFTKFYDNILHDIAKSQLLELFEYDEYLNWLLTVIFKNFEVDMSYLNDQVFKKAIDQIFNKLEYRDIPKELKTKTKFLPKSVNIGDQLSQIIGIYYPNSIDTYIKYVKSIKYYGRYMDDFYIIANTKEELLSLLNEICEISEKLGIHINTRKTHIVRLDKMYRHLQVKYSVTNTGRVIKMIHPKRISDMRRRLKKIQYKVLLGEAEYSDIEEMFKSWMGGHYKIMSAKQRKNLISLYEDLFNVNITIIKISGSYKLIFTQKEEKHGTRVI